MMPSSFQVFYPTEIFVFKSFFLTWINFHDKEMIIEVLPRVQDENGTYTKFFISLGITIIVFDQIRELMSGSIPCNKFPEIYLPTPEIQNPFET